MIKTFDEWCVENDRTELLDLWDERNDILPNQISYGSKKKVLIKCEKGLHESRWIEVYRIPIDKKGICRKCNSFAQWGIDTYGDSFLDLYWDYDKNIDIDPWSIDYSSRVYVYLKCVNSRFHESYRIRCNTFVSSYPNNGCPCCHIRGKNGKPVPKDSIGYLYSQSVVLWGDKNDISAFDVTPFSHKKVWWKCEHNRHEEYLRPVSEMIRCGFRCPSCVAENNASMLQMKVADFINNELHYNLKHEDDCSIDPLSPTMYKNTKLV